ncbi:SWIM zinc finger family protein [Natronorubrum sp. A-ect3]|uniref:SWIM zinc finger family protein n=1 Tax=Natronorubrum sp. A-ect3 TaxID=3242698 RepID=UPI00359DB241
MTTNRDYHADGRKADELRIDARDVRAIEEEMTVLGSQITGLDDGEFEVVSQSGRTYLVDVYAGSCTCPDHEHNDNTCKHIRRVVRETGRMPTQAIHLDALDVSSQFDGEHVDGEPEIVPPQDSLEIDDAAGRAVADGGQTRPADCSCVAPSERDDDRELPCFPCYEAGFQAVNPEVRDR